MDLPAETIETTIKIYLRQMRTRLDEPPASPRRQEAAVTPAILVRASRSRSMSSSYCMR